MATPLDFIPSSSLELPEPCIARILSFTTPRDVCQLASVSKTFLAASQSDVVWDALLPTKYFQIIQRAAEGVPLAYASKRELFFRLCDSISLDKGVEKYWLHRSTGQECHALSARALFVVWGEDRRYWHWTVRDGSWFQEVAYLKQVCWYEVRGYFQHFFQQGLYTVSFRIQTAEGHGWARAPVKFTLFASNGYSKESRRFLKDDLNSSRVDATSLTPMRFVDGWMEYDIGEFMVEDSKMPINLIFSMIETEGGNWKSGVFLDGVIIQPSNLVKHD